MKNKILNLVVSISLIISIIIGVRLVNKDKEKRYVYLAMGDFLTSVESSFSDKYHESLKIDEYNKFLSRKSMTSSDLLRLISVDSSIVYNGVNKSISSVLELSKVITISVGYNDVMNNVRYNSITNTFIYDEEIVNRILSSLQSNIFDIIENIYAINDKANVYVLSTYFPYPRVDNSDIELFENINETINLACMDAHAKYIDISGVSKVEYIDDGEFIPNEDGMEYIASLIM